MCSHNITSLRDQLDIERTLLVPTCHKNQALGGTIGVFPFVQCRVEIFIRESGWDHAFQETCLAFIARQSMPN